MEEFSTTDILLAAYLKVNGFNMVKILKENNKGTFVFKDVPQETIDDFDLGNAKVEPISYNNSIKQLTTSVRRMG